MQLRTGIIHSAVVFPTSILAWYGSCALLLSIPGKVMLSVASSCASNVTREQESLKAPVFVSIFFLELAN